MGDPERIWLQPECCTCPHEGRQWCEDNVFECEEGEPAVEYIRADLAAERERELKAELARSEARVAQFDDERTRAEAMAEKLMRRRRELLCENERLRETLKIDKENNDE